MALHPLDLDVAGPRATAAQLAAAGRAAAWAAWGQSLTVVALTGTGAPRTGSGPARVSTRRTGQITAVTRAGFLLQDARGVREFYLWADLWAGAVAVQGPGGPAFQRAFHRALGR
jgi:hypothetical protein